MNNKLFIFALLFCFLPILAFSQTSSPSFETGKWSVDGNQQDGSFSKGSGERIMTIEVKFSKEMKSKPEIILNVTTLDAANSTPLRFDVSYSYVTTEGFLLKVKTWADTKIFNISGTWLALPKQ